MPIAENISKIQKSIELACEKSGRDPASVQLMAVSKGQSPSAVDEAYRAGLKLFGESKVQEAKAKIPLCPGRIEWHMIGHLQTNKVRDALACFSMIQGVDSLRLAEEINQYAERLSKTAKIMIEVNAAGEASKFGYRPAQLIEELKPIASLKRIELHGLMTIAPWSADPERARPFFRAMRELKEKCEHILNFPLPHLSMGMSGDYSTAIQEGSTLVRIGTSIFGARPKRIEVSPDV